jgi:hypothetical protein
MNAMKQDFRNLSSRDEVAKKTEGPSCIGCHRLINPLAFAGANNYDSIGRFITTEKRLQMDQSILRFPVNSRVDNAYIDGNADGPLDGPYELAQALAQSQKAPACYLMKRYAALLGRAINPDPQADGCTLQRSYKILESNGSGSLMMTLKALIGPEFQYRRIEK